ncbi:MULTISPECIES: hypothetical protein [unclassified Shewanella]|nr:MULTISPECIES: hypothetical protein [unclassified Shewanella]
MILATTEQYLTDNQGRRRTFDIDIYKRLQHTEIEFIPVSGTNN